MCLIKSPTWNKFAVQFVQVYSKDLGPLHNSLNKTQRQDFENKIKDKHAEVLGQPNFRDLMVTFAKSLVDSYKNLA